MKTYNKAGFSLIELLVALSILAVVAAIIVPRFLNVRQSAATVTAEAQRQELQSTVQKWLSLGGSSTSLTTAGDTVGASNVLAFISTSNAGSARTTANTCSDSTGAFGSGVVSLNLTNVADKTKVGFTWTAGTDAYYNDGTSTTPKTIKIDSAGNVTFN